MIRRKLSVGDHPSEIIHRRSSVDRDPAFVDGIPLTHGYDRSTGADRVYGAEWGDGGNPEIRGGVGRRFFYADDRHRDPFSGFHRGRFDVQPVMESGTPFVRIAKAGMRVEKTTEKDEQQNKDTCLFRVFHRKILFYYVMPVSGRGADTDECRTKNGAKWRVRFC